MAKAIPRVSLYVSAGSCFLAFALAFLTLGCEYRPVVGPDGETGDEKFAVIVIDETAELFDGRVEYRTSKAFHDTLRERGHIWRNVDPHVKGPDGQTPADVAPFIAHSQGKKLPRFYLVSIGTGKTVASGDLPHKPSDLLAIIAQHKG